MEYNGEIIKGAGIEYLKGKTVSRIDVKDDKITFYVDNAIMHMFHKQDCCECVYIESITGSLNVLFNSPITMAEEVVETGTCVTWTFYKLATIKGYVTIRWCGESNGWYSESVDITVHT